MAMGKEIEQAQRMEYYITIKEYLSQDQTSNMQGIFTSFTMLREKEIQNSWDYFIHSFIIAFYYYKSNTCFLKKQNKITENKRQ